MNTPDNRREPQKACREPTAELAQELTAGVYAEAEMHRESSALREDKKYYEQNGRQHAELGHQKPIPRFAAAVRTIRVHCPCTIGEDTQQLLVTGKDNVSCPWTGS